MSSWFSGNMEIQLNKAVFQNDEDTARRLLEANRFEVSFLSEILHLYLNKNIILFPFLDVAMYHHQRSRIINNLMEHGANPRAIFNGLSIVQESAITQNEATFQLFISDGENLTDDLIQLRGCYHMEQRDLTHAYQCFFPNTSERNTEKLVNKYCELMATFKSNCFDLRCLKGLVEGEESWVRILIHLIQNTRIALYRIDFTLIRDLQLGFESTCELLNAVVLDKRSTETIEIIFHLVRRLLHEENPPISAEQEDRIAAILRGFLLKSALLTCRWPNSSLKLIKFFLEKCGCSPNERTPYGCSMSKIFFEKYYQTGYKSHSTEWEELKNMLEPYGYHICQTKYVQTAIGWRDKEPRRLQCLAASSVVETPGLDTSRLPKLLQDFVAKH